MTKGHVISSNAIIFFSLFKFGGIQFMKYENMRMIEYQIHGVHIVY